MGEMYIRDTQTLLRSTSGPFQCPWRLFSVALIEFIFVSAEGAGLGRWSLSLAHANQDWFRLFPESPDHPVSEKCSGYAL